MNTNVASMLNNRRKDESIAKSRWKTVLLISSTFPCISVESFQYEARSMRMCKITRTNDNLNDISVYKPKALYAKNMEAIDNDFLDADSLGIYSEKDYNCLTEYEWESGTDPNIPSLNLEYVSDVEHDEEGIEVGWDPIYGPSNPIDTRTVITPIESYMVDPVSADKSLSAPMFNTEGEGNEDDPNPEIELHQRVQKVRKDMKRVDTYIDPWLDVPVPRHVARWFGYPETSFPSKDYMNNRFTKPEDKTDFTKLDPYRARKKAVEMARSRNTEWLPLGVSHERRLKRQSIYKEKGILVGSLKKGEMDETMVKKIQPALKVLGSCVELLQISEGASNELTVFRFHYKGAMKNRRGMAAWTEDRKSVV